MTDVNEAPASLNATGQLSIAENTAVETKVADLAVLGDPYYNPAFNTYTFTTDDARFTVHDGALYLKAGQNIDFEAEPTIAVTVKATDTSGDAFYVNTTVNITVNNLDEVAPAITSGATAAAIDENSGADQVVYTATADDSADIWPALTFSLDGRGRRRPPSAYDETSGAVPLIANPNFERSPATASRWWLQTTAGNKGRTSGHVGDQQSGRFAADHHFTGHRDRNQRKQRSRSGGLHGHRHGQPTDTGSAVTYQPKGRCRRRRSSASTPAPAR